MTITAKGVVAPSSDPMQMLISRLVEHEGIKKFAYKDTKGYITVGIGRCLQDGVGKGLSIDECFYLLKNDLADFKKELSKCDWFNALDDVRQGACIEMAFNIGMTGFFKFTNTIDALKRKSFTEASKHLLDSKWASDVGFARSHDVAYRLGCGRYK